jgi:transposase
MPVPKAQHKLKALIEDIKSKKFKYKPKDTKPIDSFFITEAQVNELRDYLVLVKNMVDEAVRRVGPREEGKEGRPPKPVADKAKAVLLQQYFEASNRVAAGLAEVFGEKLGIKTSLGYKDIERAYSDPDVMRIIDVVFAMSTEPVKSETKFSIDGTGMPTSIKQNYANDRDDNKKRAVYDMLIGMVSVQSKLFSAFDITGPGSEAPFFIPLLDETMERFNRVNLVCSDGTYFTFDILKHIVSVGAVPRIMPREDTVLKSYGCMAKKKMLLELLKDPQKWLEEYHNRSISESANSVLKRRFTRPLLKRRGDRRVSECSFRVCTYNLRRLGYIHYINRVPVKWLHTSVS